MHRAAIVPEDHVVHPPLVAVYELRARRMPEQELEDRRAFLFRHAGEAGREPRVDVERLSAGDRVLANCREGKEWFRCTSEQAIAAIREVSGRGIITENFKQANRDEAQRIVLERARLKELRAKAEIEIGETQKAFNAKFDDYFTANFPEPAFSGYWICWSVVFWILFAVFSTRMSDGAIMIYGAIAGAIAAFFHVSHVSDKQKRSQAYQDAVTKRAEGLATIRADVEQKYSLLQPPRISSDFWHPE